MFRLIFFIGIAFILLLVVVRFVNGRPYPTDRRRELARLNWMDRLIYFVMLVCLFILAATGIWSALEGDGPMTGWSLIIHCGVAPPFAIGLAALAVSLADRCRVRCDEVESARLGALQNLLFWLVLVFGLIAILSAVLPMTGFDQSWQHWFYEVHKNTSLITFILIVAHAVQFFNSRGRDLPQPVSRGTQPV